MHALRHLSSLLVAGVGVALALTACGSTQGVASTPSGPTAPATIELPADRNAAVVRIGPWLPAIAADGRVFTDARVTDNSSTPVDEAVRAPAGLRSRIAPAPPVPQPVAVAQMTPAGVQAVLREAQRLGMLATPPDYGDPRITDSPTATITLTTAVGTFEHDVYAPSQRTGDAAADAARDRFDEFGRFVALRTRTPDAGLSESEPYVPTQWIVELNPYYDVVDDAMPWPYSDPPVEGCRTFPVKGGIDTATGVYSIVVDGRDRLVSIKPALPFDHC